MAIPKENRQQMINMMYLVLTALLALNVSAEILNAFSLINKGLQRSNTAIGSKNEATYSAFAEKLAKDPNNAEIKKYMNTAMQVKSIAADLEKYISGLEAEVEKEAEGIDPETGDLKRRDDVDISTRMMVEGPDGAGNGKGYDLKKKIDESRKAMLAAIEDQEVRNGFNKSLPLSTEPKKGNEDWVREQFFMVPAIATQTLLTKIKNDIKSSEGQINDYLMSQIGVKDIKFDQFNARIVSPSSYVLVNEPLKVEVFLSASSSKSDNLEIVANGARLPIGQDGVAVYNAPTGAVGERSITGFINVKNFNTGEVKQYKFPDYKYTVATPFANVSADKMNVFYIGVDNPVSISAAGVAAADLGVSITNGSISTVKPGNYTVRVTTQGDANITVKDKKGHSYGPYKFRVKRIPDPVTKVANRPGGRIPAAEWKAQKGPAPILENFDFEAKFNIVSFNMFYQPKMQDPAQFSTNGTLFSDAMRQAMNKAKPGDIFYIEEIKAVGPDGQTRKLAPIAFKID